MDQQNIMHRAPGVAQSNTKREIQPVVISLDDASAYIQEHPEYDNLPLDEVLKVMENDMTNKQILALYPISGPLPTSGRYWAKVNGKKIFKTHKEDLEKAIIDFHKNGDSGLQPTIQKIFSEWKVIRTKQSKPGTYRKDFKNFERFIKSSPISKLPLTEIRQKDGYAWVDHCLSVKPDMKEKYFKNLHGTINSILDYCVGNGYMTLNPLKSLVIDSDLFTPPTEKEDASLIFSDEEQKQIIQKCMEDSVAKHNAIPLGIVLLFHLGIRDGELCAIKWKDIDGNRLHIRRQLVENSDSDGTWKGYKLVEHTKSKAGNRILTLNTQAQELFRRIRVLNLDNGISITDEDLVFQRDYKGEYIPCNTRSFEPRLKRYCRECNMPELKSQHDIRRTVITNLYYKGVPLKEIQRIAGHSSLNMTMSYIKFQDNDNDADYMERLCANS